MPSSDWGWVAANFAEYLHSPGLTDDLLISSPPLFLQGSLFPTLLHYPYSQMSKNSRVFSYGWRLYEALLRQNLSYYGLVCSSVCPWHLQNTAVEPHLKWVNPLCIRFLIVHDSQPHRAMGNTSEWRSLVLIESDNIFTGLLCTLFSQLPISSWSLLGPVGCWKRL